MNRVDVNTQRVVEELAEEVQELVSSNMRAKFKSAFDELLSFHSFLMASSDGSVAINQDKTSLAQFGPPYGFYATGYCYGWQGNYKPIVDEATKQAMDGNFYYLEYVLGGVQRLTPDFNADFVSNALFEIYTYYLNAVERWVKNAPQSLTEEKILTATEVFTKSISDHAIMLASRNSGLDSEKWSKYHSRMLIFNILFQILYESLLVMEDLGFYYCVKLLYKTIVTLGDEYLILYSFSKFEFIFPSLLSLEWRDFQKHYPSMHGVIFPDKIEYLSWAFFKNYKFDLALIIYGVRRYRLDDSSSSFVEYDACSSIGAFLFKEQHDTVDLLYSLNRIAFAISCPLDNELLFVELFRRHVRFEKQTAFSKEKSFLCNSVISGLLSILHLNSVNIELNKYRLADSMIENIEDMYGFGFPVESLVNLKCYFSIFLKAIDSKSSQAIALGYILTRVHNAIAFKISAFDKINDTCYEKISIELARH